MDGQRQRSAGGRRRRKARAKPTSAQKSEPVLIVARRPDAPRVKIPSRNIAASARPKRTQPAVTTDASSAAPEEADETVEEKPRRAARIVQAQATAVDDVELLKQRLLQRLLNAEGRGAATKAVDALDAQQIAVPDEQEFQLQLLEHVDERRARAAMDVLARLFERQTPVKRPILDQRLRRLECEADDAETRDCAASLRRTLRVA
jgi:hypothetical protein